MRVLDNFFRNLEVHKEYYNGLSVKEARNKLEQYGMNTISEKKKISALRILFGQFSDFMVIILLACTVISAFMGEITEAVTIIAIVTINAILGFIQEFRTEKTMDALKSLAAPTAKVIRDGKPDVIQAEEVVPGDLIILEAGDRIPADAIIIECNSLQVDESLLTGESLPVEKAVHSSDTKEKDRQAKNRSNLIYMGTVVTYGRAKAIVHATGMKTEMGKIADMIQNIEEDQTPLQKRLDHLGKFIVYGCLLICTIVSITGILRGESVFNMLIAGISLAVAAVPEGLPAIVTIALALGVQRMLRRNALIRKLPAVETLGCASVICSDKTGTLTENRMTVRKLYTAENIIEIKDESEKSGNPFTVNGRTVELHKSSTLRLLLEIGGVCNNSSVRKIQGGVNEINGSKSRAVRKDVWEVTGDPTEGALLIAGAKAGLSSEVLSNTYFRIDEIPFDSDRKLMSVICDNHTGETFVFTKGAPDVIIKKCSKIVTSRGISDVNPAVRTGIMKINDKMAGEALRVLGFAYKKLSSRVFKHDEVEDDLIFVGLMGMIDPPRKEAVDAVLKCRMAGIKPVMITGDHKITAAAIARELNIYNDGDKVLTGAEIDEMGEKRLEEEAEKVAVYARVSPKHKLMIVKALKRNKHIVAMTGDGVNDAPAVKEADIGVSMGITGTDVTKEASSMILLDDNFATIVAAIEEGRVIYNNIRKFIRYMLACNLGEVLTMFLGMLMGFPIPLLPIQILWVNLVTDGLPAIALGLDPPEKDIMKRHPRGAKENIFSNGLLNLILIRGCLIGLSTLLVFASILYFNGSVETARTAAFATLVLTQLIHVFECKSERKNIFDIPIFNNIPLVLSVLCSLAMILGVLYIPFLQVVFNTVSLNLNDWIIIAGFSALGPVLSSFFKIRGK
ncbi:MAG: calcium-translocating P-type ATPase, SERCA-type [Bacillota bacterium]|nr:calcium-translocating P-type ATPase, SERCA-type [Bacillota bacterium]